MPKTREAKAKTTLLAYANAIAGGRANPRLRQQGVGRRARRDRPHRAREIETTHGAAVKHVGSSRAVGRVDGSEAELFQEPQPHLAHRRVRRHRATGDRGGTSPTTAMVASADHLADGDRPASSPTRTPRRSSTSARARPCSRRTATMPGDAGRGRSRPRAPRVRRRQPAPRSRRRPRPPAR